MSQVGKVSEWITTLFPGARIQEMRTSIPKNIGQRFKANEFIHPSTPLPKEAMRNTVPTEIEGFVLFSKLTQFEKYDEEVIAVVWFDPEMPCYDPSQVFAYFDKYKMPRPVLAEIIPELTSYHPKYGPQPPFASSNYLVYIAGMIYHLFYRLFNDKHANTDQLKKQMKWLGCSRRWVILKLFGMN